MGDRCLGVVIPARSYFSLPSFIAKRDTERQYAYRMITE